MVRSAKYCDCCKQVTQPAIVWSWGELFFGFGLLYGLGSVWIVRCPQCRNFNLKEVYWSEKKNPQIINDATSPVGKEKEGRVQELDRSYYETLLNVWASGQNERDKFWLTISLSGIGVLLAVMFGSTPDLTRNLLALVASGYFSVSVYHHWRLLSENALHVETILFSLPDSETLKNMADHERWARIAVMNAILSALALLIYITFSGAPKMSETEKSDSGSKPANRQLTTHVNRPDDSKRVAESLSGLSDMKPAAPPTQPQGSTQTPTNPGPQKSDD
jgi:hypothetical protein